MQIDFNPTRGDRAPIRIWRGAISTTTHQPSIMFNRFAHVPLINGFTRRFSSSNFNLQPKRAPDSSQRLQNKQFMKNSNLQHTPVLLSQLRWVHSDFGVSSSPVTSAHAIATAAHAVLSQQLHSTLAVHAHV